jgi:hypothetical protein
MSLAWCESFSWPHLLYYQLDLYNYGNNHRTAPMFLSDPISNRPTNYLLQLMGSVNAISNSAS